LSTATRTLREGRSLQPIDRFYESVARNPDAVALAGTADGDATYADLARVVAALATAFQELDGAAGSRVAICLPNSAEHLIALLATYAAGKVWVPLSPRYPRGQRDAMIAATRPSIVIDDPARVLELVARYDWREPARVERAADDAQIIKFSGGSTGTPKPVVQSQRCVNAQADGLRDFFEFRSDDVNLIAAPLTHGASCFVLPILEVGGRHVLTETAKPDVVFRAIAAHAVTTMYAPPTLLYSMIESDELARAELRSLRHVIYSAAPMPARRIRDCQRALGPVIETAYGQVEAPQIITAMRADELLLEENLTSVGKASSVVSIGIVSADGAILPSGEVGEIVVSGPLLMTGYLDRAEETDRAIADGWLHTGDLGMIDDRGYLYIRGRLREVINTGGFKVYPADVEASLAKHRAVEECAVFGVPDAKWGEAVNAAVVIRSGATVQPESLIAWVKAELGSVKAPKRVWLVDHLERNAAGKVSRAAVRASLMATL
jgi:acyl-CoA synthetase (AMP-forming)/AMP-acid ligase II